MFERFSETARRVIFFSRYHASQFGSSYIATEHLLLGMIAEDRLLAARLRESQATLESVRSLIQSRTPARQKLSTSVDLPLDQDSRRALEFAAEESEALQHSVIDTGHLILGLAAYRELSRLRDSPGTRHRLRKLSRVGAGLAASGVYPAPVPST
jgi:ATP-dependent Clp protease ATP-binding subunit ClpC